MKEYTFDLHSHTVLSDGRDSMQDMLSQALMLELNYLAITDHNYSSVEQKQIEDAQTCGLGLIPGFELSVLDGHVLVLGIDSATANNWLQAQDLNPNNMYIRVGESKLKDMLQWAIDQGGLVVVAHPGIPSGIMSLSMDKVVEYYQRDMIHGAEAHNSELHHNMKRAGLGHLYKYGRKQVEQALTHNTIPAYANSDAHSVERLANWHNAIVEDIKSQTSLLSALKRKQTTIYHRKK